MNAIVLAPKSIDERLKEILGTCAIFLAKEGIVESPAHVAVLKYNPKTRLNKYFIVFDDWADATLHPLHVKSEWEVKYEKGFHRTGVWPEPKTSHPKEAAPKGKTKEEKRNDLFHNRLNAFQNEIRIKPTRYEQIKYISAELKKVNFFCPLTEIAYEIANQKRQNWWRIPLSDLHNKTDSYYPERQKQREEYEKAAGCQGDWDYGVEIEALFLNAHTCNHYAVYFLNRPGDENNYVIAACCGEEEEAEKIHLLENLIKPSSFAGNPFLQLDSDVQEIKRQLLVSVEIPTNEENAKWVEYEHKVSHCNNVQLLRALLEKKNEYHAKHTGLWPIDSAIAAFRELENRRP